LRFEVAENKSKKEKFKNDKLKEYEQRPDGN
jgi:hypothetical protein